MMQKLMVKWYQKGKEVALSGNKFSLQDIEDTIIQDINQNWEEIEKYETKTGAFIKLKEQFFKAYYLYS